MQLRVKDRSASELRAEIREAQGLCARAGAQLIVNDYWQLAIEEGCDFVHLGQGDLDTADVAAIRKAGVKIGVSTHEPGGAGPRARACTRLHRARARSIRPSSK